MPKRAKIGDVLEIPTAKGLAYAQYTHQHRTHGGLIRVFEPLFEKRPVYFSDLVKQPLRFSTFFPVNSAVHRGIFKVVAHEQISIENQVFPIFRLGNPDLKTKKIATWWLWDGNSEWKVEELTAEQRKFPIRSVWNDTMLIHRIDSGWTPSNDPA